MKFYCIKCSKFTKTNNNERKWEINRKTNLCSRCIDCKFKKV